MFCEPGLRLHTYFRREKRRGTREGRTAPKLNFRHFRNPIANVCSIDNRNKNNGLLEALPLCCEPSCLLTFLAVRVVFFRIASTAYSTILGIWDLSQWVVHSDIGLQRMLLRAVGFRAKGKGMLTHKTNNNMMRYSRQRYFQTSKFLDVLAPLNIFAVFKIWRHYWTIFGVGI